jgi:hypothetical protein
LKNNFLALIGHLFCLTVYILLGIIIIPGMMILQAKPDFLPVWAVALGFCSLTLYAHLSLTKPDILLEKNDFGWVPYLITFFIVVLGTGLADVALITGLLPHPVLALGMIACQVAVGAIIFKRLIDYHMANT